MDKEGNPLAKDIIEENEKQISLDRLPQYPKMVIESYLNEFMKRGIEVKFNIKEPISTWKFGLKDTMSVLGNLIENSIEAVEDVPKKWIEIAFTNIPDSDSLQLCISNPSFKRNRLKEKS